MFRSGLTPRAEVTATSTDHDTSDDVATSATRLARPLVNAQFRQEVSRAAFDIDVVAETRTLQFDGALQHLFDSTVQSSCGHD